MSLPEPPPASQPNRDIRSIEEVLSRYGLTAETVVPVGNSAMNQNYRVDSAQGHLFVCIYRAGLDPVRVAAAERMARHVHESGIPAALPLESRDGRTLHVIERRLVAVFPWIDGATLPRGVIDPGGAMRLGTVLGRLHATLADYHDPALRSGRSGASWDTGRAIDVLSRVDDLIRYYPAPPAWQQDVQRVLRRRLQLLESGVARPRAGFDSLATQPVHGDFHDGNVLFRADGGLAAVVDWDMCGRLPPAYELLRAVSFSQLLDEPLLAAFLKGYRSEARLDPADCDPAVDMWWQAQLHDTWAFRERFIEGNRAVDSLFASDAVRLEQFADPAFRAHLAASLRAHAA